MPAISGLLLGITQAGVKISAGRTIEQESKVAGKAEDLAATNREIERKEKLNRAMATQIASAGTRGVLLEGSPLSVINETLKKEERATQRDKFETKFTKMRIRQKARAKKGSLKTSAALGLLGDIGKTVETGPTGGGDE